MRSFCGSKHHRQQQTLVSPFHSLPHEAHGLNKRYTQHTQDTQHTQHNTTQHTNRHWRVWRGVTRLWFEVVSIVCHAQHWLHLWLVNNDDGQERRRKNRTTTAAATGTATTNNSIVNQQKASAPSQAKAGHGSSNRFCVPNHSCLVNTTA